MKEENYLLSEHFCPNTLMIISLRFCNLVFKRRFNGVHLYVYDRYVVNQHFELCV